MICQASTPAAREACAFIAIPCATRGAEARRAVLFHRPETVSQGCAQSRKHAVAGEAHLFDCYVEAARDGAADERPDDGYPGVDPLGVALACGCAGVRVSG